jgi:translation initiation factor eIF-2B subunit gamma
VGAKAELVRSVTQAGFEVEAGGVYKNEKLEVSDWTTAPVEDESEDESEEESEEESEDEEDGEDETSEEDED